MTARSEAYRLHAEEHPNGDRDRAAQLVGCYRVEDTTSLGGADGARGKSGLGVVGRLADVGHDGGDPRGWRLLKGRDYGFYRRP